VAEDFKLGMEILDKKQNALQIILPKGLFFILLFDMIGYIKQKKEIVIDEANKTASTGRRGAARLL
jgi:hypothetical protein